MEEQHQEIQAIDSASSIIPRALLQPLMPFIDLGAYPQDTYENYLSLLRLCTKREVFKPLCILLDNHPSTGYTDKHIKDVVMLFEWLNDKMVNLTVVDQPGLVAARITLLRFIAKFFSLADNSGDLRKFLEQTIEGFSKEAKIDPVIIDIQYRIHYLIHALNPVESGPPLNPPPPPVGYSAAALMKKVTFKATFLYNHLETHTKTNVEKHSFITPNIILGMLPGSKRALELIALFKAGGIEMRDVYSCVQDHELYVQSDSTFTSANPAFWRNMKIRQFQIPFEDFTVATAADQHNEQFHAVKNNIFHALNQMHTTVEKENKGVYVHCKAGKNRSARFVAIYLVLFSRYLTQPGLDERIKEAFQLIIESRLQISHTELHMQSVKDYVLAYLDSEYKSNRTYFDPVNIDFSTQRGDEAVGEFSKN
jgi:protein-tyrosine phosphatase